MSTIFRDLQYALRQLRRSPGFTLTAVLTLSLTVGLAATVFSVFDALLVRPLPYGDPARIVSLEARSPSGYTQPASWPEYRFWRDNNHSFTELAGYSSQTMNLLGPQGPTAIHAVHSTTNLFAMLGVHPLLGRTFVSGESERGRFDVAVLSYSLWRKNFGANPKVLGSKIDLDGRPMTVIGVMPAGFRFPLQWSDAVYAPFTGVAEGRVAVDPDSNNHFMPTLARLKPGVSLPAAAADMTRVLAGFARVHPESAGRRMQVVPVEQELLGQTGGLLHGLLLAVLAVLALGCVNIAGLLLVRGLRRERELALRSALGAGRGQLLRQLFAEIGLLALPGTAGGALAASALLAAIRTLLEASLERGAEVQLNAPVLLASLLAALLTLLIAGLLPARQLLAVAPADALRSGSSGSGTSRGQQRLRSAFISTQMALAMLLLITSGLLLRSLATLRSTDLGFRTDHLLIEDVNLSPGTIKGRDLVRTFYDPLLERVRALPGVESAAVISLLPIEDNGFNSEVQIVGKPPAPRNQERLAEQRFVSPGYYGTMGTRLVRGRLFDPALDTPSSRSVVVVNQAFVKKFFAPGEDPIGQHIAGKDPDTIVGVVTDQRQGLYEPPRAEMDYSITALTPGDNNVLQEMQLVIHTSVDPLTLAEPLRRIMQSLDPGLPFRPAQTMASVVGESLVLERMESWLFGVFAALAVLLAALGLYGLIAQGVEQGRRDIGVRMALGAQRWQVLTLLLRRVAAVSLAGLCAGLALAFALRRVIASILTLRTEHEVLFLASLGAGMELIALLACTAPALRAASVDPVEVLRAQ